MTFEFKINPKLYLFGLWTRGIALDQYSSNDFQQTLIGELLDRFKFNNDEEAGKILSSLCSYAIRNLSEDKSLFTVHGAEAIFEKIDVIVPVPHKLEKEGDDYFFKLASEVGSALNIPVDFELITRKKPIEDIEPEVSADERFYSLKHTFSLKSGKYSGKNILLMDDLFATGASLYWNTWDLFAELEVERVYTFVIGKKILNHRGFYKPQKY